jgi:hypothetical protein
LKYKRDDTITTYRDADYFQWRYFEAPYRSELDFYVDGANSCPAHCVIARHVRFQDVMTTRILDVFGDFDDLNGLKDILKFAAKDAINHLSGQITILVTLPQLRSALRSIGFQIVSSSRFCWYSTSPEIMNSFSKSLYHWSLADSDNDAPE